mgnify:CR=1 FL=1|uniref:Glycosyltransferase family 2 protein n=1 Tax=Thermoanaerobaculum aquaticum TaxID=1312852 RepID=A0A7C2N8N4_9BACT
MPEMANGGVELSVVIPTAGRAAKLASTLQALGEMAEGTPSFEVVVVLDGEDPATREALKRPWSFPLVVVAQPRLGAAAARNLGCRVAHAPTVLFVNDDTRPHPACLRAHWEAHVKFGPAGALGFTVWDPEAPVTPYMRWLAPAGHQFNFSRLKPYEVIPWDACWTTNLSVPRSWVLDEPLDEGFPGAAAEDSEWGYRLWRRGWKILYLPDAVCFHDHPYTGPKDFRSRARMAGAGARLAVRRHPELVGIFMVKPLLACAARALTLLLPAKSYRQKLWDFDFRWNYLVGMVRGRKTA